MIDGNSFQIRLVVIYKKLGATLTINIKKPKEKILRKFKMI